MTFLTPADAKDYLRVDIQLKISQMTSSSSDSTSCEANSNRIALIYMECSTCYIYLYFCYLFNWDIIGMTPLTYPYLAITFMDWSILVFSMHTLMNCYKILPNWGNSFNFGSATASSLRIFQNSLDLQVDIKLNTWDLPFSVWSGLLSLKM